jgi:hypothetical protein
MAGLIDQELRDVTDFFIVLVVDVETDHLVEPPLTLVGLIETS